MGQQLLRAGEPLREVFALASGSVAVRVGEQSIGSVKPGQLVATAGVLIDGIAPCDFVLEAPGRYVAIPLAEVQAFLDKDPDLQSQIRQIISVEARFGLTLECKSFIDIGVLEIQADGKPESIDLVKLSQTRRTLWQRNVH